MRLAPALDPPLAQNPAIPGNPTAVVGISWRPPALDESPSWGNFRTFSSTPPRVGIRTPRQWYRRPLPTEALTRTNRWRTLLAVLVPLTACEPSSSELTAADITAINTMYTAWVTATANKDWEAAGNPGTAECRSETLVDRSHRLSQRCAAVGQGARRRAGRRSAGRLREHGEPSLRATVVGGGGAQA
jgi:hypothetical protein